MNDIHQRKSIIFDRLYDTILDKEDIQYEPSNEHQLLRLQIELENGEKVFITPNPTDEPYELATEFCEQHNLEPEMIDVLAESIAKSIQHSKDNSFNHYNKRQTTQGSLLDIITPISYVSNTPVQLERSQMSKKSSISAWINLYQKGIKFQEAKKSRITKQQESRRQKQLIECTHKPKINPLSRIIIAKDSYYPKKHSFINNISGKQNEKIMNTKRPAKIGSVDYISQQNISPLNRNKPQYDQSVFVKLYQQHKLQQMKKSKLIEQKKQSNIKNPAINIISQEIMGNSKFSERLHRYAEQKENRSRQLKMKQQKQAKQLYHPKVGPAPANRNTQKLPIGHFLYLQQKKKPLTQISNQNPSINSTSKQIYERKKQDAFDKLFSFLDREGNGKIVATDFEITRENEDLWPILEPLYQQIQIMNTDLTLTQFSSALNALFQSLNPIDKSIILNFNGCQPKVQKNELDSFKPKLNKHSKELVKEMQRSKMSIYQYCTARSIAKANNIQNEKIYQERQEMRQCTFQPKIQKRNIYY